MVLKNTCVGFCLQLDNRQHVGLKHVDKKKRLPIDQRFKKCLSISAFTFFSEMCPQYMTKIYKTFIQNNIVARNSSSNLSKTLRTKTLTQKSLFYFRDTHLEWFTR